jgi:hypothetical protein
MKSKYDRVTLKEPEVSLLYSNLILNHVTEITSSYMGSAVGIATGYRLDSPKIESRWRQDVSHLSIPALGPTQTPVQWVPGLSWG